MLKWEKEKKFTEKMILEPVSQFYGGLWKGAEDPELFRQRGLWITTKTRPTLSMAEPGMLCLAQNALGWEADPVLALAVFLPVVSGNSGDDIKNSSKPESTQL